MISCLPSSLPTSTLTEPRKFNRSSQLSDNRAVQLRLFLNWLEIWFSNVLAMGFERVISCKYSVGVMLWFGAFPLFLRVVLVFSKFLLSPYDVAVTHEEWNAVIVLPIIVAVCFLQLCLRSKSGAGLWGPTNIVSSTNSRFRFAVVLSREPPNTHCEVI